MAVGVHIVYKTQCMLPISSTVYFDEYYLRSTYYISFTQYNGKMVFTRYKLQYILVNIIHAVYYISFTHYISGRYAHVHVPPPTDENSHIFASRSLVIPQPPNLNPQPSTLNPQPSNLNPQPSTLNPQHSTHNTQP